MWRMVDRSQKRWWEKWDASMRNEATQIGCRHSSGAPVDRIRIIGARFLVSSGIRQHPRIPWQTQISRARTIDTMGSRYLAGKKLKTKRSQFIIKLNAVAVAMVLKLCQRWQPQTSATGNVISWNLGPLGIHAAQPYIAQAMRKKAAGSNCNAAGDPDSPRKQV